LRLTRFIFLGVVNFFDLCIQGVYGRLRFHLLVEKAHYSSICSYKTQIKGGKNIEIGRSVTIGPLGTLGASSDIIKIGAFSRIARGVVLETGSLKTGGNLPFGHISGSIIIGEAVVIYSNAIILAGVTVGRGSVIGAGCVVSKDVPPFSVITFEKSSGVTRRPSQRKALDDSLFAAGVTVDVGS